MTVIVGFNCIDGLVLCSDSLDTDGVTKTLVNKVWSYETQGQWGIAVGQAGESDFCDSFTDNLKTLVTGYTYNRDAIMLQLRTAINAARTTYPDLQWAALFAMFGPMGEKKLLRLSDQSKHLAPVNRYEAVGIGSHLAKFFCSQISTVYMRVEEAARLGIFTIRRCTEHVAGCDGPISVLTWTTDKNEWIPYPTQKVKEIEDNLGSSLHLRQNLIEFWQGLTPDLSRITPQYTDTSRGGRINMIRAAATKIWEQSEDKPRRSTSRKSKRVL